MVGIDLGTTNSLVSVFEDGVPRVLSNELGEELTPSAVAVAEDGTLLVGRAAKDRLIVSPESGSAFFKRDMGTSAAYRFGGRRWTPLECSAVVLREMKRVAELHLGSPVTSAVISVPAYFHDHQRQATIDAAKIAGLHVERLINEPTAAALAHGFGNNADLNTLLVFDLGGGTFDVTVLECFDGVMEVKASAGESRLGGEDFTDALVEWINKQCGWTPEPGQSTGWRQAVDQLKRQLTEEDFQILEVDGQTLEIGRTELLEATSSLLARLRPVMRKALRDAQLTPKQLDAVLLVGGASRMPLVQQVVMEDFGSVPCTLMDPDRAVAMGAAVQQALCTGSAAVKDLVLTDVCPHSLGVEVVKALLPGQVQPGFFDPILDRNTTVPVSRSRTYYSLHPMQDEALIKVYQGESRLTKENHHIGQVRVTGLRQPAGRETDGSFEVRFSYDMNGILEVEVTVQATGAKLVEVFEQRPGTMTKAEIAECLRRIQPLKVHPRETPAMRARLERAERLYIELNGTMRTSLSLLVDTFEAALATQDPTLISATAAELDNFMSPFFPHG